MPDKLVDYDVLITLKPRITRQSLTGVERPCAIGRCGVGYDNIDVSACTESNVAVYNTPSGVIRPMAESVVLFILALSHNLVIKDRLIREGRWVESMRLLGHEPRDRVISSIGLGNIACEVVRLLKNFGIAQFLTFDPYLTEARAAGSGVVAAHP